MLNIFQQGQFGRRKIASAAAGYGLDSYTTGLWAAYGLNKMLTSYSGSAVRVRRSSDNAEQDIGFSGNSFDSAALATFVGANSAFVTTWYDQTGNSRNMLQATAGRQPRIVNAGVADGKLVFNPSGVDDFLKTTATGSSSVAAKTIFQSLTTRARNANNIVFEYGDSGLIAGGSGANQIQNNDTTAAGNNTIYLAANSGSAFWARRHTVSQIGRRSMGCIFRKGQANSADSLDVWQDGSQDTGTDLSATPTTTGNFPAYTWSVGNRATNPAFGAQIDLWCCAIYDADKAADALAINAILDTL